MARQSHTQPPDPPGWCLFLFFGTPLFLLWLAHMYLPRSSCDFCEDFPQEQVDYTPPKKRSTPPKRQKKEVPTHDTYDVRHALFRSVVDESIRTVGGSPPYMNENYDSYHVSQATEGFKMRPELKYRFDLVTQD